MPLTVATAVLIAAAGGAVASGSSADRATTTAAPARTGTPVAAVTAAADAPAPADDEPAPDDDTTADAAPEADAAATEPAVEDAATDPAATDPGTTDAPAAEAPPVDPDTIPTEDAPLGPDGLKVGHVWVLAVQDPDAKATVEAISGGGVTLTNMRPAPSALDAALAMTAGVRPPANGCASVPAVAPATEPCEVADGAPSLPSALLAAGRGARSYVDGVADGRADGVAPPTGACDPAPAGDAVAAALSARSPFGHLAALRPNGLCAPAVRGLGDLTADVAAEESAPAFSYLSLGGCTAAPPGRPPADQLRDALTTITSSPAYTAGGMVVVTATAGAASCGSDGTPGTAAPAGPAKAAGKATPSVVFTPWTPPGTTTDTSYDALSVARSAAVALGVDPPAASADDAVTAFGEDVLGRAAPGAAGADGANGANGDGAADATGGASGPASDAAARTAAGSRSTAAPDRTGPRTVIAFGRPRRSTPLPGAPRP